MAATRLTPRKVAFATALAAGASQADAARSAGYSGKNARGQGYKLMSDPRVKALVEQLQAELRARTQYTAEKAMDEAEEALNKARTTDNATAMVSAVQLRAKISGLLVDRVDARVASFAVNIVGIDRG